MPYISCLKCSSDFYVKPSHQKLGWGKYCSNSCKTVAQRTGYLLNCTTCQANIYVAKNRFNRSKSGNVFCGKSCQTDWRNRLYIEEKHSNWTGGEYSYRQVLKRSGRKKICVSCGIKDKRVLVAHHLDHNRKNNKASNLTWLCHNCHHLIHSDESLEKSILFDIKV